MDRQPVLEGERLLLRPLTEADWEALYAVASDPDVWALHPVSIRWQEPVFRAFFAEAMQHGGALVAVDRETGRIVGSSQFRGFDSAESCVEIGWTFLARSHWGGAFNGEMKRLMLAHALRFADRVDFRIGETNLRSRRAMEKIGGLLSERTEVIEGPAGPIVHLVYEIDRANFAGGPLSS